MLLKAGLAALALLSGTAAAETAFVRVYGADAQALAAVAAQTKYSQQYGDFVWLEIDASALNTLRRAGARVEAEIAGGQLRVNGHHFDPAAAGTEGSFARATLNANGEGLYFVQFQALTKQAWVEALQTSKLKVLQYYPSNSYLVWGKPADVQATRLLNFVRGTVAMDPNFKLDTGALARSAALNNLNVFLYNDGAPEALRAQLTAAGMVLSDFHPAQPDRAFYTARGAATPLAVQALAAMPQVVAIGTEYAPQNDDELAAQILTRQFNPLGTGNVPGYAQFLNSVGLSGEGIIWGINDSGTDWDHPDLASARSGGNDGTCAAAGAFAGDDASSGGHGTHVAGAVAGRGLGDGSGPSSDADGLGYSYGRGVAPRAKLYTSRLNCGFNNRTFVSSPLRAGARGSNNSWNNSGGAAQIRYLASEREYDVLVREGDFSTALTEGFMVIFSAGNAGPGVSTITGPHVAKNIISVGSSSNGRPTAGSANNMSSFSSRGPAEDGRIMPTLTGVGGNTASTRNSLGGSCATAIANTSNLYANCSGTSMSTPMVSGAAALVNEFYGKKFFDQKPSPAMVKAILINGTRDLPGTTAGSNDGSLAIPNNDEGWGILDLNYTFAPTLKAIYRDQQSILTTLGQSDTVTVVAADPNKPLKITLVWTDAPGAVGANPAQVNDLDLSVTQAGNSYRGNVFAGGTSVTGGNFDRISNIENVYIANPGSAPAILTVNAAALNADALAGNGSPSAARQDYALVCSNCLASGARFSASNQVVANICRPAATVTTSIAVVADAGYTGNVSLSAPSVFSPVTGIFNPATISGGSGASQLSFTAVAAAPAGIYGKQLFASSANASDKSGIDIWVSDAATSTAVTDTPISGAINQNITPTLKWAAAPNALSYSLEVSTSAGFGAGTIVYSTTSVETSAKLPTALLAATTYFWRVTALNACGTAAPSAVASFSTSVAQCSASVLSIPDNSAAGVEQVLGLSGLGAFSDLNVRLEANHTRVGDLRFLLSHVESGRSARLFTRQLGCVGDNIQADFDDQASNTVVCLSAAPSITGTRRPEDDLARFNGLPLAGTFKLTVADQVAGDTGEVTRWCISPSIDSQLVFGNGFE